MKIQLNFFFLLFFLLTGLLLFKILLEKLTPPKKYKYKFYSTLFSPAERSFYGVLEHAVGENFKIFGKVRVGDIFKPNERGKSYYPALNKVNKKHFDFVLCSPDKFEVKCIIELDDKTHNKPDRIKRDEFLNEICENNKIPFLQFAVMPSYNIQSVREAIITEIGDTVPVKTENKEMRTIYI